MRDDLRGALIARMYITPLHVTAGPERISGSFVLSPGAVRARMRKVVFQIQYSGTPAERPSLF